MPAQHVHSFINYLKLPSPYSLPVETHTHIPRGAHWTTARRWGAHTRDSPAVDAVASDVFPFPRGHGGQGLNKQPQ
jgi:hypothetical protein